MSTNSGPSTQAGSDAPPLTYNLPHLVDEFQTGSVKWVEDRALNRDTIFQRQGEDFGKMLQDSQESLIKSLREDVQAHKTKTDEELVSAKARLLSLLEPLEQLRDSIRPSVLQTGLGSSRVAGGGTGSFYDGHAPLGPGCPSSLADIEKAISEFFVKVQTRLQRLNCNYLGSLHAIDAERKLSIAIYGQVLQGIKNSVVSFSEEVNNIADFISEERRDSLADELTKSLERLTISLDPTLAIKADAICSTMQQFTRQHPSDR